jgi:para-nitrobenzyl esterase
MRLRLTILILALLPCSLVAQQHCDGVRYIQSTFGAVDSTIGIQYGQNTTSAGLPKNLYLDVYTPGQEFFFARPLVIVAFGGSFLTGTRKQLRGLCLELASRGFVAATIDYRLFDAFNLPMDSLLAFDVAIKATSDMKAAIRWFRENAGGSNEFGIDSNLIFVGGVSSGAIAALHAVYLDSGDYVSSPQIDSILTLNGGIRGNSSTNYQYSDGVKGVLNFSGALKDARWIDAHEPTLLSVHDELDDVVPYKHDVSTAIGTAVDLWGSFEITREARADGIRAQLITIANSTGHVSYFMNTASSNYAKVIDSTARFLEYTICNRAAGVREKVRFKSSHPYPNPSNSSVYLPALMKPGLVVITDATGQELATRTHHTGAPISLEDLAPGIYFITDRQGQSVRVAREE